MYIVHHQATDNLVKFLVKVDQKACFLFIKRTKKIRIIIKVRSAFIGADEGNPMLVLPTLLIANLHISSELFAIGSLYRDG